MNTHHIAQDLLGSEGPGYASESYGYENHNPYWSYQGESSSIDPQLDSLPPHQTYPFQYQHENMFGRSFTTYDPIAHGFRHPSDQRSSSNHDIHQLGFLSPAHGAPDQYRHIRYLSPTDPTGFTFSSNESSVSEYALSPDVGRTPYALPFSPPGRDLYGLSLDMTSNVPGSGTWAPQSTLLTPLTSTPIHLSQTAFSMRDLQVTPDPQMEDDPMDDRDALQPKLNPEELELTEQFASPVDSGIGPSIHGDDTISVRGEWEDAGAVESDNDSEFIPVRRRSARASATQQPHGLRTTDRLSSNTRRNSTSKGVLGQHSRVTKNSKGRKPAGDHGSRAKAKKVIARGTKHSGTKAEPGTKSFPCTFHHYGCHATFANKNEWKRHVSSQHLQLGYFRCDLGTCAPNHIRSQQRGYNDFNRKDLFTQHCRRMHAPWSGTKKGEDGVSKKEREKFEKDLETIRERCWIDRRKAPIKSNCGFCGKMFVDTEESKAWDERMEHVGRHFERDSSNVGQESVDAGLKQWAIDEGLVKAGKKKGEWWLAGYEPASSSRAPAGRRRSGRLVVATEDAESDDDNTSEEDGNESDVEVSADVDADADADAETEDDDDEVGKEDATIKTEDDEDEDEDEDAEGEDE